MVKRKDKIDYYLDIAQTVAQRATCLRRKYGAIIVSANDEIISTGYNGAARGCMDCIERGVCKRKELNIPSGERYELCLAGETVVKLLDGTYESIESLAKRGATDFWVYAVDTKTGEIVPAKAYDARQTGVRSDIYEIVLDNGATVRCTGDHRILLRDCTFKEAKDLVNGESLMPMYYNYARNGVYESVLNTVNARQEKMKPYWKSNTKQIATHHLVYNFFNSDSFNPKNELIHHKDESFTNNTPENLEKKDRGVHSLNHLISQDRVNDLVKYSEKGREQFIQNLQTNPEKLKARQELGKRNMMSNWENQEFVDNMKEIQKKNGTKTVQKLNTDIESIRRRGKSKVIKGISALQFAVRPIKLTEENYEKLRDTNVKPLKQGGGIRYPKINTILKYFKSVEDAIEESKTYNHKVIEVRKLDLEIPVYDLTVPNYENFAVDLGDNSCIFVHNCISVHAEQNAIISAARRDMIGGTLYLAGLDAETGKVLDSAEPCMLCRRFILNSGISSVVVRKGKGYEIQEVSTWRLLENL